MAWSGDDRTIGFIDLRWRSMHDGEMLSISEGVDPLPSLIELLYSTQNSCSGKAPRRNMKDYQAEQTHTGGRRKRGP